MALRRRQEIQEKILVELVNSESEQMKRFEEFMELKQRQEYQSVRDMMDREYDHLKKTPNVFFVSENSKMFNANKLFFNFCRTKESIGRQEKLKEEQRHRMKVQ